VHLDSQIVIVDSRIPLLGPGGLTEQLWNVPYAVERTFRLTILRWLRVVRWGKIPRARFTHRWPGYATVTQPYRLENDPPV
jgi:hypothetical protein